MGDRGPSPTPTKLKVLRGNPGRRPLNENEPDPEASIPEKPDSLSEEAAKVWDKITIELDKIGLLSDIDGSALEMYCEALATFRYCSRKIAEHGGIGEYLENRSAQTSQLFAAQMKALDAVKKFCTEFGMTPASRSRISVKKKDKKRDSLGEFLGKKGTVASKGSSGS